MHQNSHTSLTKLWLAIILLGSYLWPSQASASLNGTSYTINPSLSASSTNYKTFAAAVSDLVSGTRSDGGTANGPGITGAVVFTVANGTYSEQISISTVSGVSSSNTITFTGNSSDSSKVILTYPSSNVSTNDYTLSISTNWITFNKMTISRTGTGTSNTVIDINGGSNLQILSCHIIGVYQASSSSTGPTYFTNGPNSCIYSHGADTNNLFQYNRITYGLQGFFISNGTLNNGNRVLNNRIDTTGAAGIYALYQNNLQVVGNIFTLGNITGQYVSYGIRSEYCAGYKFLKNYFLGMSNASTVRLLVSYYGSSSTTNPSIVANNFILMTGGTGTSTAIAIAGDANLYFYFNTVLVTNTLSTASAFYTYSGYPTGNYIIKDNIFYNKGGGLVYDLPASTSAGISAMDYNEVFTTGAKFGNWGSTAATSFTGWRILTSMETNSKSVPINFISNTDPHIFNPFLKGSGISISAVTDDIDGEARPTKPDIGADQMKSPSNEASLYSFPNTAFCPGSSTVMVNVRNYGNNNITSLKINWTVDGVPQTVYSYSGTIKPDSTKTITLGNYNFTKDVTLIAWTSSPNGTTDSYTGDDSLTGYFTVPSIAAYTGVPATICGGTPYQIGGPAVTGNSYSWTSNPAGFTSTSSTPTVSPTTTTVYYLTEKMNSTGCTKTDSIKIKVNPAPAAYIGTTNKPSICLGNSIVLGRTAVAGNTYKWMSGSFIDTNSSITVTPAGTGVYTYILTETVRATGCMKTDTATITVLPVPKANVGSLPLVPLCPGSGWTIGSSTVFGNTYIWTSKPAGLTSTKSQLTVNPSVTTTYYLTETVTATGCKKTDSIKILVNPQPKAFVGTSRTLCYGSSTTLGGSAVAGNTYSWTSTPAGFGSSLSNPTVSPTVTTVYRLKEVNVEAGCTTIDSIKITVLPKPNPSISGPVSVCAGKPIVYKTPYSASSTYKWNITGGTISTFSRPDSVKVVWTAGFGNISVRESNTSGCSDSMNVQVNVRPAPVAGFTVNSACPGIGTTFNNTSTGGFSWFWDFGDGQTSPFEKPVHLYTKAGTYKVRQLVQNDVGCADTVSRMVVVSGANANFDVRHGAYRLYYFAAKDKTHATYLWDFGDGSNATTADAIHTYQKDGNFIVRLTVADAKGCTQYKDSALVSFLNGIEDPNATVNELHIYPNPFRQTLMIDYQLNSAAPVNISISDVTGRELTTMNKGLQPAGHYSTELNSLAEMVPGIYFVRITAGDMLITRQVVKIQ